MTGRARPRQDVLAACLVEGVRTPSTGCLLRIRNRMKNGYARVNVDGGKELAHRFVYEMTHGVLPHDQMVLHSCDVRNCIEATHLFLGDAQANTDDMYAKGREARGSAHGTQRHGTAYLPQGEVHKQAKVTSIVVRGLRERYPGETYAQLALTSGLSETQVRRIVRRENWKDV